MKHLRDPIYLFQCALLALCCWLTVAAVRVVQHADALLQRAPDALGAGIKATSGELAETRAQTLSLLAAKTDAIIERTDKLLTILDRSATDTTNALWATNEVLTEAQANLADTEHQLAAAGQQFGTASEQLGHMREDALPVVSATVALLQDTQDGEHGALRDARVALAETARAAITVQHAMPEIVAGVERTVEDSDRVAQKDLELHAALIGTAQNLQEATRRQNVALRLALPLLVSALLHYF